MTFESIMGILFWILILGIAFLVKASTFGTTMTIMSFLGGDCGFAVRLYKMLDEVRRGNKSYEWFVADFNVICNTEANERPVRMTVQQLSERNLVYAKYMELVNNHRDLVEKYMMGPKFRFDVEYKSLMSELKRSGPFKDSDVLGSTKIKYTTFRDLLTKAAPENTISRMSKYFSVKRKGIEVGLSQCHLEDKGYIRPVDRKTYVELAKAEFGITLSYTSIAAGVKGINRDDYTDEAREIIQTFEEYLGTVGKC